MWKDFFYFSRAEKQGIIVLVVLIGAVILAGNGLSIYRRLEEPVHAEELEEEYERFMASLRRTDSIEAQRKRSTRNAYFTPTQKQPVILTRFDPNSADSITFCQMGLAPWIARNILRYRAKGGIFRTPQEFRKVYGLSEEQYATLLPYMYIGEEFQRKDTIRILSERNHVVTDTVKMFKYPIGTIVSLNNADTTELKKIPGIGSATARKIVNYRKQLGGFYHVAQLQEINLNANGLMEWFNVEDGETTRINLNKVSVERLKAHPYFNFYQAKVIVEHRKRKGDLKRWEQLAFYEEFTDDDIERMKHYTCFE